MTDEPPKIFDVRLGEAGPELVIIPQGSQCASVVALSWDQLRLLVKQGDQILISST